MSLGMVMNLNPTDSKEQMMSKAIDQRENEMLFHIQGIRGMDMKNRVSNCCGRSRNK